MVAGANLPPALFLAGPTASGKTALAVELVKRGPFEIVSVDSALVYRGMDIGTAKPDADTLQRAPHRLIDICDPAEAYSAARFVEDANREMQAITAAGNIPLLVGGTMLYYRSLQFGLSALPESSPEIRAELELALRNNGSAALHAELAKLDPVIAERLHPNDPQRIMRAIEVYRLTGRPLSEQQASTGEQVLNYRLHKFAIAPAERSVLHERIALRFAQMLEQGFEEEVAALMAREDIHSDLPSMRSVGYRQMILYLQGQYGYQDMKERGIIATRQLAKRQFTWLRADHDYLWLDSAADDNITPVMEFIS